MCSSPTLATSTYPRRSAVTDPWLPLFSKAGGGVVQLALRVRPAHCNGKGFLHGGVINALADNDATVRREAIYAVARNRSVSRDGLPLLKEMRDKDTDSTIRKIASEAYENLTKSILRLGITIAQSHQTGT